MGPGALSWLLLLLLLLGNAAIGTTAAAVTSESQERVVLGPSRLVVGWSQVSPGTYRFTLVAVTPSRTWVGLGTSQGTGLGKLAMTANAGAVVGTVGALNVGFSVLEYALNDATPGGVQPWETTGPSQTEITRCVQKECTDASSRCQTFPSCVSALSCAGDVLASASTNPALSNSSVALNQALVSCMNASAPAGSTGAFLETSGCFFSKCFAPLNVNFARKTNLLPGATFSQVQQVSGTWTSTLTFSASRIGNVALNQSHVTFIAAIGADSSLAYHGSGNHAVFTTSLETGLDYKYPVPDWVLGHAVLMTVGLGMVLPFGVLMKALHISGHPYIQLTGVMLGVCAIMWAAFFVENVGSRTHHVLGIITIVLVVLQPFSIFFRPSQSRTPWAVAAAAASAPSPYQSKNEMDDVKRKELETWGYAHAFFGYLSLCLAIANAFLGYDLVSQSQASGSSLIVLPIIFVASTGLAFVVSVVQRVRRRAFPSSGSGAPSWARKTEPQSQQQHQNQHAMTSANPSFQGSSNINARSNNRGELAGDDDDDEEERNAATTGVSPIIPMFLAFQHVSYRAPVTKKDIKLGKDAKQILHNCSGFCPPRSLTAIMGPSGSGKTTLLDLLASRALRPPESNSVVEVNGVPTFLCAKKLSRTSGYVLQQDVLHEYLTVFETLIFAARLVVEASDQVRYDRVMRVIAQLGLGHACDTKIGGPNVRGLSGGERRRVSIAIQMVKSPSLLFLDEPTSGLDSHTSLKLIEALRDLANEGRTVIATIHQPSAQLFEFFDRLILLSQGRTVWSGTRTTAEKFFASKNRPVPPKWNPADWFLLVVDTVRGEEDGGGGMLLLPRLVGKGEGRPPLRLLLLGGAGAGAFPRLVPRVPMPRSPRPPHSTAGATTTKASARRTARP